MKTCSETSPGNYIHWINLVEMHSNLSSRSFGHESCIVACKSHGLPCDRLEAGLFSHNEDQVQRMGY